MCRRDLAIVLVSGGMDSCVTAGIASLDNSLAFLHVNYGQKTEKREERAFNELCDYFKPVKKLIVNISYLKQIGGSALTDEHIEIPKGNLYQDKIPITYVPFRNAHLLSIAVSWAEVIKAKKIYIGAVEEDSSGYPDCKEAFFQAFQDAVNKGTKPDSEIKIITPIIHKKKSEIVKIGTHLGVPFHLTWSCYKNEDLACGQCDSCLLRIKAFQEAGIKDPIKYQQNGD